MPMPTTVVDKLTAMGVTLEQARGWVFDHLDNPGMIAITAHHNGITIDMLAQIVGHGASGLDVSNFFRGHGIGHNADGEIELEEDDQDEGGEGQAHGQSGEPHGQSDEPHGGASGVSQLVHEYLDAMHEAMDVAGHPPEGGMSVIVHQYIEPMVELIGSQPEVP